MNALILFAHGSRDPAWAAPFRAIQRKVSEKKPGLAVELAFLEIMEPSLPEIAERLVAAGATKLTIAPLFMAHGAHLKKDLAEMLSTLKDRHPRIEVAVLPVLGEADTVLLAISEWLAGHD